MKVDVQPINPISSSPAEAKSVIPDCGKSENILTQSHSKSWFVMLEIGLLGAVGGSSFLFLRIASPEIGSFAIAELRVLTAAMVLLPFLWASRTSFPLRTWPKIAFLGMLNATLPFVLFAWAAERAPAGIVAITNSTAVLFAWLFAGLFWGERIGRVRMVSLLLGFIGVAILVSSKAAGATVGLAVGAGTLATAMLGLFVNMVNQQMRGQPPVALAAATFIAASIELLPLAVVHWPTEPISYRSWFSVVMLGSVCTGIASGFYYQLIKRIGGPRASTVAYLFPLFAVSWGWLLLDEPVTWSMVSAGLLIVGSVAVAQRVR